MDQETERAKHTLKQARYEKEHAERNCQRERSELDQQQQLQQQHQFMMMMMTMMNQTGCGMVGNFGGASFGENSEGNTVNMSSPPTAATKTASASNTSVSPKTPTKINMADFDGKGSGDKNQSKK